MDGDVNLTVDPHSLASSNAFTAIARSNEGAGKRRIRPTCCERCNTPVTEPTSRVSALLVVQKPAGQGVRICMDPKFLNAALQRSTQYMQTIDDILPNLNNVKVMSTVDIRQAFRMLKLDKELSIITSFETPFGRYR